MHGPSLREFGPEVFDLPILTFIRIHPKSPWRACHDDVLGHVLGKVKLWDNMEASGSIMEYVRSTAFLLHSISSASVNLSCLLKAQMTPKLSMHWYLWCPCSPSKFLNSFASATANSTKALACPAFALSLMPPLPLK